MIDFLRLVMSFIPLCIKEVEWDGDSLVISGEDWRFVTNSAWRVSQSKDLLFACWDNEVGARVEGLTGLSVVHVSWIANDQPIDPSFTLSDGRRLDVFCSSLSEPWVMKLPDNRIYIGNS